MAQYEIFPTMITPYHQDGTVNYDAVERYVQWYFEKGCTGVFAVCQSSEIAFLTLEERVNINRTVWNTAKRLEKEHGRPFTVVSSGHVADSIEGQIEELQAIAASGTDALIFITNRLDIHNEGDDVWIANAEKLLAALPKDIPLGLYECPLPYKRLVTPKILRWCLQTGRFRYMKDTCCDAAEIARRNEILAGSDFKLLNANCQTLLQSLQSGGGGYCGIMANFHPELYVWLCENFSQDSQKAALVQALLGTIGFTEAGTPYPLTAKYHLCLEGIPSALHSRNRQAEELTDYMK
ncbi:MAG: dihydrodipicolinate synthase family protein, partial [Clostridia bacterium]|nr:dihydrodipicolinate synthase family protein [Clostridia bacterium]